MNMDILKRVSKRKRIEISVRNSVNSGALSDGRGARSGLCILSVIGSFVEIWPAKYFDIADDRKVAGLVLAYMLEISEIDIDDLNARGRALLKFSAELDLQDFQRNTPRTFESLVDQNLLGKEAPESKPI